MDRLAIDTRPVFLGTVDGRFGVLGGVGVFHAFARDGESRVLTRLRLGE